VKLEMFPVVLKDGGVYLSIPEPAQVAEAATQEQLVAAPEYPGSEKTSFMQASLPQARPGWCVWRPGCRAITLADVLCDRMSAPRWSAPSARQAGWNPDYLPLAWLLF
jgi:hypothetical protein